MKSCLALLGVLWLLAASSSATAQIQLSAQTERSSFLLYERVDLIVTLVNVGGTDLILNNDEGRPWLSFLVAKHDRLPVRQERSSNFRELTLKTGETKTLRVNLTPLFSFREEGDYRASAVIDLPGQGQIVSPGVPFNVLKGRTVWSQLRSVNGSERTYSLVRFSPQPDSTQLYLRVEDPGENIVYTNLALGEMASYIDPEVYFDPKGNIHVLQPIALATYLYTRADSDGKILGQRTFKTFHLIPPRLTKVDDGNVMVVGGLTENPDAPREKLSETQNVKQASPPGEIPQ